MTTRIKIQSNNRKNNLIKNRRKSFHHHKLKKLPHINLKRKNLNKMQLRTINRKTKCQLQFHLRKLLLLRSLLTGTKKTLNQVLQSKRQIVKVKTLTVNHLKKYLLILNKTNLQSSLPKQITTKNPMSLLIGNQRIRKFREYHQEQSLTTRLMLATNITMVVLKERLLLRIKSQGL